MTDAATGVKGNMQDISIVYVLHLGDRGQPALVRTQRANVPEHSRESVLVARGTAVVAP